MTKVTKKEKKKETKQTKPEYHKVKITCACGAQFDAGSTKKTIRVDICSACHPYFTGGSKILDTEGRVDRFKKKYKLK